MMLAVLIYKDMTETICNKDRDIRANFSCPLTSDVSKMVDIFSVNSVTTRNKMTRNAILGITALIICNIVVPTQTTVLEQDTMIEVLLLKVAELEKNQQECSSYQSKMLQELSYLKDKLQQSERRISELETIVYKTRSYEYTEHLDVTMEKEPAYKPTNKTGTRFIKEKNIRRTPELKGMHLQKSGILKRQGRGIANKQIGFSATIVKGVVQVIQNEIIHFDTVLHNEGNGFNKQTGVFTCPLSGTYFFTISLLTHPGSPAYVHLIVNGQIKANSFAYGITYSDQGSISTIVRCEAGQNVWISLFGGTQIYGEYYTSFSGFFLWGDATGSR
ncbi:hypothetical protein CHS0354_039704 [Potamilus streckersoni]|uniref:C1q domain-containing protein n=1 Tax=Potamilus streckersoni TaxID=2493646 RepID=A0AAE0SEH9_9BIVA|nr:hypothetical protein CHS0354_039704 [Potamilus streckersoni]